MPYIPLNKTEVKYSNGELFTFGGSSYIGKYIIYNNIIYAGETWTGNNQRLLTQQELQDPSTLVSTLPFVLTSVAPTPFRPRPTENDYTNGVFRRYFVKARNNNLSIYEISLSEFNRVLSDNNLNSTFKTEVIDWSLNSIDLNEALLNRLESAGYPEIKNVLPPNDWIRLQQQTEENMPRSRQFPRYQPLITSADSNPPRVKTIRTLFELGKLILETLPNENNNLKISILALAIKEQRIPGTNQVGGFNNNHWGIMGDIGVWSFSEFINGCVSSTEGEAGQGIRTTNTRWFVSFATPQDGIRFMAGNLKKKGFDNATKETFINYHVDKWLGPGAEVAKQIKENQFPNYINIYTTASNIIVG